MNEQGKTYPGHYTFFQISNIVLVIYGNNFCHLKRKHRIVAHTSARPNIKEKLNRPT